MEISLRGARAAAGGERRRARHVCGEARTNLRWLTDSTSAAALLDLESAYVTQQQQAQQ